MVSKIQNACLNNIQHSDGDEIFQITVIHMPKKQTKNIFFKNYMRDFNTVCKQE